jgi:hypothetical protein
MRAYKDTFRIVMLIGAVLLCMADPKPASQGYKTDKQAVYYTPQPEFEWRHRRGNTYRIVLSQLPSGPNEQRRVLDDVANYTQRSWRPKYELDFERRYELFVWDQTGAVVTSWQFTVGYQPPVMISPKPGAKVNNLSPEFRIEPFEYSAVWYYFEISEDNSFGKIVENGWVAHKDNVKEFPGEDNELGTKDDIRYVPWTTQKVLKPNKTYFWRVRGYYYLSDELTSGAQPERDNAIGHSTETGSFTIPPGQSGSDSLANLTIVTADAGSAFHPAVSVNYDLVYTLFLPAGGSELRVATAELRGDQPVFGTGREEFSKSIKGSRDLWPTWDVDGEGIFFASDRSQRSFNLWYKRRDARGYTQLTFHSVGYTCSPEKWDECGAYGPSVAKDGNKISYYVSDRENEAGASVWKIDRDGRSATEVGSGERPKYSHDGKQVAFAKRDSTGDRQIWTMDADGGNRVQLTSQYDNQQPEWHPDGKRIVFISNRSENYDIWELELGSARMRQLTNYLGRDLNPTFTPDGKFLLFTSDRGTKGGKSQFRIWMGRLN